jgi:hypothetical protein
MADSETATGADDMAAEGTPFRRIRMDDDLWERLDEACKQMDPDDNRSAYLRRFAPLGPSGTSTRHRSGQSRSGQSRSSHRKPDNGKTPAGLRAGGGLVACVDSGAGNPRDEDVGVEAAVHQASRRLGELLPVQVAVVAGGLGPRPGGGRSRLGLLRRSGRSRASQSARQWACTRHARVQAAPRCQASGLPSLLVLSRSGTSTLTIQ